VAVAGPAGGIPEQKYERMAMYYSAGAAAGLNTLIVTHGVSHHIIIGGRDDIVPPRGVKVI